MQYQDVAISDDEEKDYFAADEGHVSVPNVAASALSDDAHTPPLSAVSVVHPGGAVSFPSTPGYLVSDHSAVTWSPTSVVAVSRAVHSDAARLRQ